MSLENFDVDEFVTSARYGELDDLKATVSAYLSTQNLDLSTAPTATLRTLFTQALPNGNTALHMAAANGQIEVVKFLIPPMTPGDINQINLDGSTALHWAALNGKLDCVELLLSCGAEATLQNELGRSAVTVAEQQGHMDVVNILLKSFEPEADDDDGEASGTGATAGTEPSDGNGESASSSAAGSATAGNETPAR
ncbi:ankyrin repeat-containing domain protein [Phlyctochytrium arcticum]|nr:ankyrin repeat-containing domain protein [Phlyctochytrium arcticum]